MIRYTDMTGLAGNAIAMAAVAAWLSGVARIPRPYRIALTILAGGAALIPFGSLPPAAYLRSAIGDLSITSQVLLLLAILHTVQERPLGTVAQVAAGWPGWRGEGGKYPLLILTALAALALYPMALGIGLFDPYRLGYGDARFLGLLLLVSGFAFSLRLWLPALVVPLAVLAWVAGWYESTNLWDYLLDPLVAVYATGALLRQGILALRGRR
jgi:hypothetical protein